MNPPVTPPEDSYRAAGVDLEAGERTVSLIREAVGSTYGPEVLGGLGAFGGLYDATRIKGLDAPVLVASTDGVGTKTKVAAALGRFESIGHDIVNHCVNDILVQGAAPLFFLDYVAASKLEPERIAEIVSGAAAACREVGMALLGGETAEMPGVYRENEFDLVGTVVGVVDRQRLIDGSRIRPGDHILAFASSGLHTNGFSLARRVLGERLHEPFEGSTVGETLLIPHRCYLKEVAPLLGTGLIKGMVHVTGGGISGNLPRVLPAGLGARIETGSWPVPPIFDLIKGVGEVSAEEMFRVFNMGVGLLLIVSPEDSDAFHAYMDEPFFSVGEVIGAPGGVSLI